MRWEREGDKVPASSRLEMSTEMTWREEEQVMWDQVQGWVVGDQVEREDWGSEVMEDFRERSALYSGRWGAAEMWWWWMRM